MKAGSDNFRASAIQGMAKIKAKAIWLFLNHIYQKKSFSFKSNSSDRILTISDVIVANRMVDDIKDVAAKVYTRDLFGKD